MLRQRRTTTKSGSATLTVAEMGDIICTSSSNTTITLPTAYTGLWYNICNVGSGIVTVSNVSNSVVLEQNQQALLVNNGSTWYGGLGGGFFPFTKLKDTPNSYAGAAKKMPVVNTGETGLEFEEPFRVGSAGSYNQDISEHSGVPTMVGQAGKLAKVNSTEDGLEFGDIIATFIELTDTPESYAGYEHYLVRVKSGGGLEFVSPDTFLDGNAENEHDVILSFDGGGA